MIFTESWWQLGTLAAGTLLAMLILAVEHWFPWVCRLPRVQAYVWGVAALWVGFAAWRLLVGDWQSPAGLLIIAVAGGATVVLVYKIDDWVLAVRQAGKAEAGDVELGAVEE